MKSTHPIVGLCPIHRCFPVILLILAWSSISFCGEIHVAAKTGDLQTVKVLVKGNSDLVSTKDDNGATPLHLASAWDHKDVVEWLLANKADVNAKDNKDGTALHYAVGNGRYEVAKLLLSKKSDVNAKDIGGNTPLNIAAGMGYKKIVALLLTNKAEVNPIDNTGQTPMHAAKDRKHQDVVELLKQHGGLDKKTAGTSEPAKKKYTPVGYFVVNGVVHAIVVDEKGQKFEMVDGGEMKPYNQ